MMASDAALLIASQSSIILLGALLAWNAKYGAGPSGYAWLNLQETAPFFPVISSIACSVADFTL